MATITINGCETRFPGQTLSAALSGFCKDTAGGPFMWEHVRDLPGGGFEFKLIKNTNLRHMNQDKIVATGSIRSD